MKYSKAFTAFLLTVMSFISCENRKDTIVLAGNNVFGKIKFDEVVAYSYDGRGGVEIIDKKTGKLPDKIIKQKMVPDSTISRFTGELSDASFFGNGVRPCFEPHLGIVFYSKSKPVGSISICLECNLLVSSVDISYSNLGFSDKGKERIEDLIKLLDFDKK